MLEHGIDLHKRSLTIATVDSAGHLVKQKRLPTNRDAVVRYLEARPGHDGCEAPPFAFDRGRT
jgi:hypothetical protein